MVRKCMSGDFIRCASPAPPVPGCAASWGAGVLLPTRTQARLPPQCQGSWLPCALWPLFACQRVLHVPPDSKGLPDLRQTETSFSKAWYKVWKSSLSGPAWSDPVT